MSFMCYYFALIAKIRRDWTKKTRNGKNIEREIPHRRIGTITGIRDLEILWNVGVAAESSFTCFPYKFSPFFRISFHISFFPTNPVSTALEKVYWCWSKKKVGLFFVFLHSRVSLSIRAFRDFFFFSYFYFFRIPEIPLVNFNDTKWFLARWMWSLKIDNSKHVHLHVFYSFFFQENPSYELLRGWMKKIYTYRVYDSRNGAKRLWETCMPC